MTNKLIAKLTFEDCVGNLDKDGLLPFKVAHITENNTLVLASFLRAIDALTWGKNLYQTLNDLPSGQLTGVIRVY